MLRKRVLDVLLSAVMLVACAPFFLVVPLLIKLEDGGPMFFTQRRWGRRGKIFTVWKFRTMKPQAGSGPAIENDPRITKIGGFLRRTGLDELPQLAAIFRGEMSFVGPRPLAVGEIVKDRHGRLACYEDTPGFKRRLSVLPGLTGLATVCIPKNSPPSRKFRYDLLYVRKQSLSLDIKLIALSFLISFGGKWEVSVSRQAVDQPPCDSAVTEPRTPSEPGA